MPALPSLSSLLVPETSDRMQWGLLRWRSRRGMAEVELQLLPFFEQCFLRLPRKDQEAYARLLEADDWQINDWLRGGCAPDDPSLSGIVRRIRRFAGVAL